MTRQKKMLPILERVTITGVAAEGNAIARVDGLVVFVPYAATGDIVDVQLIRKKKNYAEGRIIHIHQHSHHRVEPLCPHFGICGGCRWQHLAYEEQLELKRQQALDCIERIGGTLASEEMPILPSPAITRYRNKLEFTFSDRKWLTAEEMNMTDRAGGGLGFHIPGRFDKVLDIQTCMLQDEISDRIRCRTRDFCIARDFSFANLRTHEGLMRTMIVRNSASTGELMVVIVFGYDDEARREELLSFLREEFPEITSLMYVVNAKCNDSLSGLEAHLFAGRDHIVEIMGDLRFRIGPMSFYQTNSRQAVQLYAAVLDMSALCGTETVYDLYTGTGTIANYLASRAAKVVGIEYVEEAVEDARANARLNGINNVTFFAGDMKDVMVDDFVRRNGRPQVIVTDPPRAGMHESVTRAILSAEPERIVYVSCNPATQSRDISILREKYLLKKIQPVDMFPHTHHVENVALLVRHDA
ncbi:MAG: 23S rRNA (uracil(1939)-C(5))-methyltransferase RlmD [Tannerellaceae bacterium]|jgi:23S rRNA (uracil1939-C5)-methyltransferase|nr:23S rRNA (uracil(1939)-C(5))-methyltransferase RlmD [Tannerellaceae bacterium]